MPWTTDDVGRHTKAARTDKEKRQWVAIANSALKRCLDGGGEQDECEARAIRQANGMVKEADMGEMTVTATATFPTVAQSAKIRMVPELPPGTLIAGSDPVAEQDPPETCVCPDCGHEQPKERAVPCRSVECPECGAMMEAKLAEAATKTVDGKKYPAGDFLVVEDPESPDTWHLQVKKNGTPDHRLMGGAKAALTVGYRGNVYEGPDKAKALAKLKALYKAEDMEWAEVAGGLEDMAQRVRTAFYATVRPRGLTVAAEPWVKEIFSDHPEFGNMIIVDGADGLYGIPYEVGGEITFSDERKRVIQTYVVAEAELDAAQMEAFEAALRGIENAAVWTNYQEVAVASFTESASGHVVGLAEARPVLPDSVVPLHLDAVLIEPGWGNPHDGHYYPREILERDAGVFEGVKMYETDHRPGEKSTRTWVSTVKEIKGFTDGGAPVGAISVHDRNFAERLLALEADGLLGKMECSILAGGTARSGRVDGRKAKIVESITEADSVDWVTRAGAGGRALALAETEEGSMEDNETEVVEEEIEEVQISEGDEEPETPAPDPLPEEKVAERLGETNLPKASKARLSERGYADEAELEAAVEAEIAYVKEITGSGKPFGMSGGPQSQEPPTEEQGEKRFNRIMREVGGREV